jgi:hypothetical protein
MKPRRRRRSGSLGSLKGALWATIEYNLGVIDDEARAHEIRQKASNCLVQASLAYSHVVELHELSREMSRFEGFVAGNGHHP